MKAVYFLCTGSNWAVEPFPQAFLLSHKHPIGDVNVGGGPAYVWFPEEVKQIHHFLQSLSEEELQKKFTSEKLTELDIYPFSGAINLLEDLAYVLFHFQKLKQFFALAEQQSKGLLFYLN